MVEAAEHGECRNGGRGERLLERGHIFAKMIRGQGFVLPQKSELPREECLRLAHCGQGARLLSQA